MGNYTKVSQSFFDELQLDAGVLLKSFNPTTPAAISDNDFVCSTTGGINITAVASYSDLGEDVDNVPNNTMELMHLDNWDCRMSFTALSITEYMLKLALGVADATTSSHKVTPRASLEQTDFTGELWWVGDMADGGFAAVCLKNVLSTGGLSLQTTKNSKGQLTCELTGHTSISAQDEVPIDFYVISA